MDSQKHPTNGGKNTRDTVILLKFSRTFMQIYMYNGVQVAYTPTSQFTVAGKINYAFLKNFHVS